MKFDLSYAHAHRRRSPLPAASVLLWLAVAALSTCVSYAFADAADPFSGDARLGVKRSFKAREQPIRDLLADLNLQTGIRFFADPSVADDRVTLIYHDKPPSEALRAVAALFNFEWRREGGPKDYSYTLFQSGASIAAEAAAREKRARDVVELVRQEISAFELLDALPDPQIEPRAKKAAIDLADTKLDFGRRRAASLEASILDQLKARNEWRRILNLILKTMSAEQLLAIMQSARTDFSWPPAPGMREIPIDAVREIREMRPKDENNSEVSEVNFLRVNLIGEVGRNPELRWHLTVGRRTANTYSSSEFSGALPSIPLETVRPDLEAANEDASWGDPALETKVTWARVGQVPDERSPKWQNRTRRLSLGDVLYGLDGAAALNVVADAFYSTKLSGFSVDRDTVGHALNDISRQIGHRWRKAGGFIIIRSTALESDRWAEPPATLVSSWVERLDSGGLELDDFSQIASLRDPQLATLTQMASRGDFPERLDSVNQAKEHLRVWNALTRPQKRKAENEGIAYTDLAPPQQALVSNAITDRRSYSVESYISSQLLKSCHFRVEIRSGTVWGVRKKSGSSIMGGANSREEAMQQLQRSDPRVKPGDLKTVVFTTVRFVYESNRGLLSQSWLQLPGRWEEAQQ